jgi:signal transduction histidine kinase
MLETLAGPDRVEGGLAASLAALSRALGADVVGVFVERDGALELRASTHGDAAGLDGLGDRLRAAAAAALASTQPGRARLVEPDLAAVALHHPEGQAVLAAHLSFGELASGEALELIDDATRSLTLAMEGEALERTRREAAALRRSQAIQRELLSSLSHELRTPLTAIQGYASTLRQPDLTWDAESTERFLRSIATEAARLERLVGDLLDTSAIESGILRLQRHWCDLRLVLEAALGLVSEGQGIRLACTEAVEPVWGDHDRLEQVFVNLLENAAVHGASDEGVDVALRTGAVPGTVEVEVRDHGPGVPLDLAERIFEPRVRGSTHGPGAGLGLPIARAIVEAHGGTLVAAPVDRGASFVVLLPCEPPADAPDGAVDGSWNLLDEPREPHVV